MYDFFLFLIFVLHLESTSKNDKRLKINNKINISKKIYSL